MTINPLQQYARDVTSQDGEDGIIAHIFEVLGSGGKRCVELGALDGTHHSNVWTLLNEQGWSGVLIEADVTFFRKLARRYAGNARVQCVNAFVSFEGTNSLDAIFTRAELPADFDLFVLDIDGADYHLWDSLTHFTPRVAIIEYNPTIPNGVSFIQPRDMNVNQGSSLRAITELAERKGYALIATTASNAFFVRAVDADRFDIADRSLDALHPDTRYQTHLYQLYDGTLGIYGYDQLFWHRRPIDLEALQVLPKRLRRYPAHIDPSEPLRRFKDWVRQSPFYGLVRALRRL